MIIDVTARRRLGQILDLLLAGHISDKIAAAAIVHLFYSEL